MGLSKYSGWIDMKYARIENGQVVELCDSSNLAIQFPADFVAQCVECAEDVCVGWEYRDGAFVPPVIAMPTLAEAQTIKRMAINAGFDSALAASLTMPSINTPPSTVEIAVGAAALAAVDADAPAYILQIHSTRRNELLAAVEAAKTAEAVAAIVVSYAV